MSNALGKGLNTIRAGIESTTKAIKETEKKITDIATDIAVIPPLEPIPLPWFILLSIITFLPIAAYGLGFSGVGYGRECMKFAIDHSTIGFSCLSVVFLCLSGLYILDFSYWESSCMRTIRAALFTLNGEFLRGPERGVGTAGLWGGWRVGKGAEGAPEGQPGLWLDGPSLPRSFN